MEGIKAEMERKQTVGNLAAVILGAVKTSVYIYLEPVITVVTSVRVLRETITLTAAAGTVLTMAGLIVSEMKFGKSRRI